MNEHGDSVARLVEFLESAGLGWLWVFVLTLWGGTASYVAKVKKMNIPFSLVELIGEWTISSFAGIVTAYLCLAAGAPFYLTAAFAGVAGHMGGRAIELLERRFVAWLGGKGKPDEDRA